MDSVFEVTPEMVGQYIRFGGRGILDGLKGNPTKHDVYRIEEVKQEEILLKGYRARLRQILPAHNFGQQCVVYSPKEFKAFPVLY